MYETNVLIEYSSNVQHIHNLYKIKLTGKFTVFIDVHINGKINRIRVKANPNATLQVALPN